jgi:hypothetical protein
MISDEEYKGNAAPVAVSSFPGDLKNPGLEYSGIYEDGWVSEHSYFQLSQTGASSTITVRGNVPNVGDPNFKTDLAVLIDGSEVAKQSVPVGDFVLEIASPYSTGSHKVELVFSNLQILPKGDSRPVGGLLRYVGFNA